MECLLPLWLFYISVEPGIDLGRDISMKVAACDWISLQTGLYIFTYLNYNVLKIRKVLLHGYTLIRLLRFWYLRACSFLAPQSVLFGPKRRHAQKFIGEHEKKLLFVFSQQTCIKVGEFSWMHLPSISRHHAHTPLPAWTVKGNP